VSRHWAEEPIARLRNYLVGQGAWSADREEELLQECSKRVDEAVASYLATPPQSPTEFFDYVYAALPAELAEQRDAVIASVGNEP
jgi:pyruvate dehydrogenase E1 component alpha subunit